jgi:proline iminopeptidase
MPQWGDDLRALCDALEIARPIVFGTSLGGMVVQSYATRHPDHPGKLILCSTFAKQRIDRCKATFERLGGREAGEIAERYFSAPGPEITPDFERVCRPLYVRSPTARASIGDRRTRVIANPAVAIQMPVFGGFDFLPALARIRCPTLVIGGEDDPVCPIADQEDIAAALPAHLVRFERFAKAGHGVHWDAPRFFDLVREFIAA